MWIQGEMFQWQEETYTEHGQNRRVYVSCNIESAQVENWLFVPFQARGKANRWEKKDDLELKLLFEQF